jgi:hypothetical protein
MPSYTGPRAKTSKERINRAKLATKVMKLRLLGWTFVQIGEEMGFSAKRAFTICQREVDRLNDTCRETAEQMRRQSHERMLLALRAIHEKVKSGDPRAVAQWIALDERIAKLYGLDLADQRVEQGAGVLTLNIQEVIISKREELNGPSVIEARSVTPTTASLPAK